MKKVITKLTPLTGLVAGVITLVVAVVGGYFEPGFDHRVDFLSELNDADSRYPLLIGYLGLVPAGMLTLIFLWRLKDEIDVSTRSIAGLMFIALIGIDLLVTHFAPCDAGCPVSGNISLSQQIHNISGGLGSVLVPIGIYLLIKPLRKAGFGAAMSAISFAAIAVLVCGFVVMVSNVVPEYIGIVQRANIGAFYIYLTLLSMRLFARTRIEHSAPSASSR
jgi:hypothetical membrane protein